MTATYRRPGRKSRLRRPAPIEMPKPEVPIAVEDREHADRLERDQLAQHVIATGELAGHAKRRFEIAMTSHLERDRARQLGEPQRELERRSTSARTRSAVIPSSPSTRRSCGEPLEQVTLSVPGSSLIRAATTSAAELRLPVDSRHRLPCLRLRASASPHSTGAPAPDCGVAALLRGSSALALPCCHLLPFLRLRLGPLCSTCVRLALRQRLRGLLRAAGACAGKPLRRSTSPSRLRDPGVPLLPLFWLAVLHGRLSRCQDCAQRLRRSCLPLRGFPCRALR
jgi:hypothetical protein